MDLVVSFQSVWKGFLIAYALHRLLILTKTCPKASKRHITLTLDLGVGEGSLYTVGNLMVHSHVWVWGLGPLVLRCLGLAPQSCGWTVFGTRRVWHGVLLSGTCPCSHRATLFHVSWHPDQPVPLCPCITCQWEPHRPGNLTLILPCLSRAFLFVDLLAFCNWILNRDHHFVHIANLLSSLVLSKAIHVLPRNSVRKDVLNWNFKIKDRSWNVWKTNHSLDSNTHVNNGWSCCPSGRIFTHGIYWFPNENGLWILF